MAKRDHDYLFKIFLIGDSAVGKTSILRKFAVPDEVVETTYISTVGIDFKLKTIQVGDKKVKLQIWDTAGQERFHSITKAFYRHAKGIMLVYDITNSSSFDNISKWLRNIKELADEDVLKMLIGNKCDLDELRVISTDKGMDAAERYNIPFMETSALNDINIKNAFYSMTRELIEKEELENQSNINTQQILSNSNQTSKNIDLSKDKTYVDQFQSCCSSSLKKLF